MHMTTAPNRRLAGRGSVDVFDYLDYRAYLRDYYVHHKQHTRGFSHRAFARRAGLRAPNHLKRVMEGERNLTPRMAARFATACRLDGEAADYFCELVAFDQARSTAEKERCYRKLTGFSRYRRAHRLELAHAEYHSQWYVPAVRELAARRDFRAEPSWIARHLAPPITAEEARRALSVLTKLGFLRLEHGHLVQADAIVSTGAEAPALHIVTYHRTMLERAAAAIDLFPSSERDISSLTLGLDAEGLRQIKRRIQSFRRELLELSAIVDRPEQVVQLNLQLFPLSDVGGRGIE